MEKINLRDEQKAKKACSTVGSKNFNQVIEPLTPGTSSAEELIELTRLDKLLPQ